ncbi:restriction endonuclease subunit S [Micromonospora sp. SH-82]|uniref:restriction endonuclease subunit S n=1 Tax=Micromonospora sp. SH-82 TaxID=3132938 RepID=UPI003EBEBD78
MSQRPFRDLVVFARGGGWGSDNPLDDHDQVSIIRGTDFGSVRTGRVDAVPRRWEKRSKLAQRVLRPGDVVLEISGGSAARGQTTGRTLFIGEEVLSYFAGAVIPASFCRVVRFDITLVEPQYAYYGLQDMYFSGRASAYENQSTGISNFQFERFLDAELLRVPPLAEQRRIVTLLSAIDGKIAVNGRIAECSLALADAHFSDAVEGVSTRPETFGSIAQVGGGGTPSTKVPEYWDGNIAWATPSDVTALGAPYLFGTSRRVTDAGLDNCASALYPAGSIFMTSRATIGAFAIPQIPMAVNQGFIVVVTPDEELMMWLLHEMRDRIDEMRSLANGSTFLELSRKNFKAMGVRLPTPAARKEFAGKAIPLHQRAAAATAENATLTKLRDTLLSELMSGRLRVRDAEKVVEEAV